MRDPREGVSSTGTIVTGVSADRIVLEFRPIIAALVSNIVARCDETSVYICGSVATGRAVGGHSDLDVMTIGLPGPVAESIGRELSKRFADRCRGVDIGAASSADLEGEHDENYGNRAFLRHDCVHIAGPDRDRSVTDVPADRRAARAFNGDIARHVLRWRAEVTATPDPADLGRRIARKTLLAVAALVSVHDATWTTGRGRAVHRLPDRSRPGSRPRDSARMVR